MSGEFREQLENEYKGSENEPDFWDAENLKGFFNLLLKVDQRLHPELYANDNNRDTNNTD
jgi:hypothetical protein